MLLGATKLRRRESRMSRNRFGVDSRSLRRRRRRTVHHRKPRRPRQRNQRGDQHAANRQPEYFLVRGAERPDRRLLSCRRPQARARCRREMVPRQFVSVLERQIAANMMPTGTLIIANVPLPPAVYRELKRQALVSKQTAAQLMTAILTRAAGR